MNSKKYFNQLRQAFKNDPYQNRFLQELQHHAEDLESELPKSKKLTPDAMKKYFGEPKEVKKTFNAIVRPWEKIFFVLEGLFYGVMILFFSLIGTDIFQGLAVYGFSVDPGVLILVIIWFFLYLFAFGRYFKFHVNFQFVLLSWVALIFGPTLIHAVLFFIDISSLGLSIYPESSIDYMSVSILFPAMGGFFGVHAILGFLACKLQKPDKKKGQSREPVKWVKQFRVFLFIYISAFIVYRTVGTYFGSPNFHGSVWQWFNLPFSPLIFIEFILGFLFSATFGTQGQPSLFFSLYFPAMLLGFLTLQSVIALIHKKTWRSRRTLIVLYALSLLFINPQAFELKPEYEVPYVSVSEMVEKKQASFLYPAMKYFNQDEGLLFHYYIDLHFSDTDLFFIQQNTGKIFAIDPGMFDVFNEHKTTDSQNAFVQEIEMENFHENWPDSGDDVWGKNLHKKLICEQIAGEFIFDSPEDEKNAPTQKVALSKNNNAYWNRCQKLFLGDQLISNSILNIEDWLFSENGNWLLLHLNNGAYDPEEVHLLDLRGLNSSQ